MHELTRIEVQEVSGGAAALFFAAAAAVAAVAVTAPVVHDNATNGSLADGWYRFTR